MSEVKMIDKILQAFYRGDRDRRERKSPVNPYKNKELKKAYINGYKSR